MPTEMFHYYNVMVVQGREGIRNPYIPNVTEAIP